MLAKLVHPQTGSQHHAHGGEIIITRGMGDLPPISFRKLRDERGIFREQSFNTPIRRRSNRPPPASHPPGCVP